jgi:hypothetical protein
MLLSNSLTRNQSTRLLHFKYLNKVTNKCFTFNLTDDVYEEEQVQIMLKIDLCQAHMVILGTYTTLKRENTEFPNHTRTNTTTQIYTSSDLGNAFKIIDREGKLHTS